MAEFRSIDFGGGVVIFGLTVVAEDFEAGVSLLVLCARTADTRINWANIINTRLRMGKFISLERLRVEQMYLFLNRKNAKGHRRKVYFKRTLTPFAKVSAIFPKPDVHIVPFAISTEKFPEL